LKWKETEENGRIRTINKRFKTRSGETQVCHKVKPNRDDRERQRKYAKMEFTRRTARSAAKVARWWPLALPIPMSAVPAFSSTLRTSAKSTLIRPGCTMMSEMPTTPCDYESSIAHKAS